MRRSVTGPSTLARLASLCIGALAVTTCGDDPAASTTTKVSPSADGQDAALIQEALINAESGDTICLMPGTYHLDRELSLANHVDVTVKGCGATRDDVVLDFAGQTGGEGDDAFTVTANGFTIRDLTLKNAPGNGIVIQADDALVHNVKVFWDAGSVSANGYYAIYPTSAHRIIIEDSEVVGASDAGIYVGSSEYAIVRRNDVHGNVAGIEIENTLHADVYDNEVTDNSAGIHGLLLPNLPKKALSSVLIRNNHVHANNRPNFAHEGTTVSYVPVGTGMMTLCGKDIEFRENVIENNDSTGIMIVSYRIFEILTDKPLTDMAMDPFVQRVYVTGNTFTGNGQKPAGALLITGQATLENVLWDGILNAAGDDAGICLGPTPPSFRMIAAGDGFKAESQSTDTGAHTCTRTALPTIESFAAAQP